MKRLFWMTPLLLLLVAACSNVAGDPADTVERYLQAKIEGNADLIGELLCSEMEADLQREAVSFSGVTDPRIEGLACTAGDNNIVSCDGTILATYGTSEEEIPLSSYRVVQEDGEWRWCGEGE